MKRSDNYLVTDLVDLDWPLKREGDYDMDGNQYPPTDCVEVKEKPSATN